MGVPVRSLRTDHDLPVGLTVETVDWRISMERLSDLATRETGRVYTFSSYDRSDGTVSIGAAWELSEEYTEAEAQHVELLCWDHDAWIVRHGVVD